jgi:hypothetical protein
VEGRPVDVHDAAGSGRARFQKREDAVNTRQSDFDTLCAMRERAQTLDISRDPLFAGAVAQLIGIIDGLIRVSVPPGTESSRK